MISSSFSETSSGAAGENADPSVSIAGSSRKMIGGWCRRAAARRVVTMSNISFNAGSRSIAEDGCGPSLDRVAAIAEDVSR